MEMCGHLHTPAALFLTTPARARLKRDGTRAETRFGLSKQWTSPFKSAGESVQSTAGSRGVRISGQTMDRPCSEAQCKSSGYPFQSPISPLLPLPRVTVCHHVSNGLYLFKWRVNGPQTESGRNGEEIYLWPVTGFEPQILQPIAQSLRYSGSFCVCFINFPCILFNFFRGRSLLFYKCETSSPHWYTSRDIIVSRIYLNQTQEKWDGQGFWHVRETGDVYTEFWWGILRERYHLENLVVDWGITLK